MKKSLILVVSLFIFFISCSNEDNIKTDIDILYHTYSIDELYITQFPGSHRGLLGYPENSLESITAAIIAGFKMVEVDVSMTKDSILVIHHDLTIDRMSNGTGRIDSLTYEQLLAYDFGGHDTKFVDTKIRTLEEILNVAKNYGICLELDFTTKTGCYPHVIKRAIDIVKKEKMLKQCLFCGDKNNCEYILEESKGLANITVALPTNTSNPESIEKIAYLNYPPHKMYVSLKINSSLTSILCDKCHEIGAKVEGWTIKNVDDYDIAKTMGADYIIIDSSSLTF